MTIHHAALYFSFGCVFGIMALYCVDRGKIIEAKGGPLAVALALSIAFWPVCLVAVIVGAFRRFKLKH